MNFYNKFFKNNYEEIKTYYPRFYENVTEMDAILKTCGSLADDLEASIELVYNDCFLNTADEVTIANLETFLGITSNKTRSLEDRRATVKTYFAGMGKVSATRIKALIYEYTGADVDIYFEPITDGYMDDNGEYTADDNMLYIIFERGSEETLYVGDIYTLLAKILPAHIEYRAYINYTFSTVTGTNITDFTTGTFTFDGEDGTGFGDGYFGINYEITN